MYKIFLLEDSWVNLKLTGNPKIIPLLAYVATLPCETLVLENKQLTINYKVVWLPPPVIYCEVGVSHLHVTESTVSVVLFTVLWKVF